MHRQDGRGSSLASGGGRPSLCCWKLDGGHRLLVAWRSQPRFSYNQFLRVPVD